MARRPNIIIFLADDMGYGDPSTYDGWIPMPSLDRLAAEGLKFTDFHSNGPVCSPTRAGLMTGRYQQRCGIEEVLVGRENYDSYYEGLEPDQVTMAKCFQRAGYATGLFGKWHLGFQPQYNPTHHGFDRFRGYLGGAIDYISHTGAGVDDWWDGTEPVVEEGYSTHLITKHSLEFIEAHKDEPFFLLVSHEAVHLPWQVPGDGPFHLPDHSGPIKPYKDWTTDEVRDKYVPMTRELDTSLAEVVAALDTHGLAEETLLLFFSDNGGISEVASNAPFRGFKARLWEGGHRVPAIARWPGRIAPGTVTDDLTISHDLMPTMLAIAGIDPPSGCKLDGKDLGAILFDGETLGSRQLFWGYHGRVAMREDNWKYVETDDGAVLFDLTRDVGETNDIATDHPDRVAAMASAVAAWKADVGWKHS